MVRLNPGTIYFVRESDGPDKQFSNLVKIGLVEGDRSPFVRLREHQTGNPRRLKFDESQFVSTDAVKYVESQLHRAFADRRVSGEWFKFETEQQLEDAVALARGLSAEMVELSKVFEDAAKLEFRYSNGMNKPASDEEIHWGTQLARASVYVAQATDLIDNIRDSLKEVAIREGEEAVEGVLSKVVIEKEPAFSTSAFRDSNKENKKLHSELSDVIPRWSATFKLLIEIDSTDLDVVVTDQLDELAVALDKAVKTHDVLALNETELRAKQLSAPFEWEAARSEALLMSSCGECEGIENICTWSRKVVERKSFNPEKLRESYPDLYREYVLPREPEVKFIRLPFKN